MTCGNPAPVFDEATGIVWLLFCMNRQDGPERLIFEGLAPRTVWVMSSADAGETWSSPLEITRSVKPERWTWYATGPGHGIQLASGRLLVPCDHAVGVSRTHADPVRSHVVFSDDGGQRWQLGGIVAEPCSSECGLVEMAPNQVLLEFRHDTDRHLRGLAQSLDGGASFLEAEFVAEPPDPGCRGGVVGLGTNPHSAKLIAVSHLASHEQRENLVLRTSTDGRTWNTLGCLWAGPAAYSELIVADDGVPCCFFEAGTAHPYEEMRFMRITGGPR
jgi:sialidase-1